MEHPTFPSETKSAKNKIVNTKETLKMNNRNASLRHFFLTSYEIFYVVFVPLGVPSQPLMRLRRVATSPLQSTTHGNIQGRLEILRCHESIPLPFVVALDVRSMKFSIGVSSYYCLLFLLMV